MISFVLILVEFISNFNLLIFEKCLCISRGIFIYLKLIFQQHYETKFNKTLHNIIIYHHKNKKQIRTESINDILKFIGSCLFIFGYVSRESSIIIGQNENEKNERRRCHFNNIDENRFS